MAEIGFASQADGSEPAVPSGGFASQASAPVAAPTAAPAGKTVNVIAPDGKVYGLDTAYLEQAKAQGYQVESPEHAGIRAWVESKRGVTGAAAVAAKALLNEATFGASDPIVEKLWDPYQNARFKALEAEYQGAHYAGAALGFGASLLYGGELFNAASKAGGVARGALLGAEKAVGKQIVAETAYRVGEEGAAALAPHAPSIARQILAHAADYGVQGLAFSAPKAVAEAITGDPDKAAETWIYGAVGGAALGGLVGGAKGLISRMGSGAAAKALPAVGEAAAEAQPSIKDRVAGKLREVGDEQAISSLDMTQKFSARLKKIKGGTKEATAIIRDADLAQHAGDYPAMAEAVGSLKNEVGGKLGDIYKASDSVVMSLDDFAASLKRPVEKASKEIGQQGASKSAAQWLEQEFLAPLAESKPGGLTLSDLHDVRVALDKATKWDATVPNALNELRKDIRTAVTDAIEKKLEAESAKVGRELVPELRALNRQYSVLKVMSDAAEHNVVRGMSNRRHSITDYAGNAIGATVGGFIGGGAGSLVGGYVGGEVNNALRRVAPAYLSKAAYAAADALEGSGMVALERAYAEHGNELARIPSVIDRMAHGGSSPVRDTMGVNLLTRFLEAHDAKLDDHKGLMSFADNLASLTSNPEKMQQKIEEATAPLSAEAPEVAIAVGAKLGQVAGYLASQAPKSPYAVPTPFSPAPKWQPTDAQVQEYRTKVAVALDPYKALDALGNGTLTKAHVDALRATAPKLYEEMVKRIADYGATGKAPELPYAQRLKLSLMTGAPLDRSLAQLSSLQSIYQSKDAAKVDGDKKMKLPATQQSDVARISG